MRCIKCNVDLPDTYKKCPLCESSASDALPLIADIKTAEFPKVKTEPKKTDKFIVFLLVWCIVSLIGYALLSMNIITKVVFGIVFTAIPLVWTVIGRPLFIKHYFRGNYIVVNFYSLTLAAVVFGRISEATEGYYMTAIPLIAAFIGLLLLILTPFIDRKNFYRAAPYAVLLTAYSIVGGIIGFVSTGIIPLYWFDPIIVCLVLLAVSFIKCKEKTKEELKAKFSIQ